MKKKLLKIFIIGISLLIANILFGQTLVEKPVTRARLKTFPVPKDYRNYFLFQSIDDDSNVLIGDFTGTEKLISQIFDRKSLNKITLVNEYFPDKRMEPVQKRYSSSEFFKKIGSIEKLKREIISGSVFKTNYAYKMYSLDTLKVLLKQNTGIYKWGHGYSVKLNDPDTNKIMGEFFFGKRHDTGRYDLIFKTSYYPLFRSEIHPIVKYSVFCKNSNDPIVKEVVDELLQLVPNP